MKMVNVDEVTKKEPIQTEETIPSLPEVAIPKTASSPGIDWVYVNDLVTQYKLYPSGTEIYIRPLGAKEVKKLSLLGGSRSDEIIDDVLKASTRGLDVDDMYYVDKLHLILWLRCNTFKDSSYVVEYECSHCKKQSEFHLTLDMLDVTYLGDLDISKQYTIANGDKVSMRLLTSLDIKESAAILEKSKGNIDIDDLTLAFQIDTINGEKYSINDKYRYVSLIKDGLSYVDLVSLVSKIQIGVNPFFDVTCTHCKEESQTGVTFHSSFFIPTRKFD